MTSDRRTGARTPGRSGKRVALLVLVAGAALSIAGCGSSTKAPSGPPTVALTRVAGYGSVLATAAGKVLYLLTADRAGRSTCSGSCATQWRPLLDVRAPVAGAGVKQSLLSRVRRADGSWQVAYDSHPLYTYTGPGVTGGAGIAANGGTSYLVAPSGKAIERTSLGGY